MNLLAAWLGQRWEWRNEPVAIGAMCACMGVYLALLIAVALAIILGGGWMGLLGVALIYVVLCVCWLRVWSGLFIRRCATGNR